jgi:putative sigma-54 modulation protein
MDIEYTGRQTILTRKLKTQAESGLAGIAPLVSRTASAHVFLTAEKYRRIAEVTLKSRGHNLVATCEATEMEAALHDSLAKLEQQAIRHKQKYATSKRHPKPAQAGIKTAPIEAEASPEVVARPALRPRPRKLATVQGNGSAVPLVVHSYSSSNSSNSTKPRGRQPIAEPHIVRSIDSQAMRPMSLEEAVKEAAFRDRDVFVFRDRYGQVMVLHHRRDHKTELIQIP